MQNKKYYSISEVTKILNIHSHQLRYLESRIPNLVINKIKNRRYYTTTDIDNLKTCMKKSLVAGSNPLLVNIKIDNLIKNFRELSINITEFLSDFTVRRS